VVIRGIVIFLALFMASQAVAEERYLTLASTTSTDNSGLFGHLLPQFTEESGITVRVVAVGTGQALRLGRNGDADALLVHHRPSEEMFVAEGYGTQRFDVMYNDFVLIGPAANPAGFAGDGTAADALELIADAGTLFVSRGDDSGTHKAEMGLWAQAGVDPTAASGEWYRELGSGMGATLNAASAMDAYVLSDRATWLAFANRGNLAIVLEGDPELFNQYGVVPVSSERYPHVKSEETKRFIAWLLGSAGQAAIGSFRLEGKQVFFPNAAR
jgi:tungstate transport system substrate-binding protein